MRAFHLFFFLLIATFLSAQGKPYGFMNYRVVDKGNIQSEYGYAENDLGPLTKLDEHFLMVRYGIAKDLEINLATGSGGYYTGGDGFDTGLITVGAKYYLLSLMDGTLNASLMSRIGLSFSDDDEYFSIIDLAVAKEFSSVLTLSANVGVIREDPYLWLQGDVAITNSIDVYGRLEYYSAQAAEPMSEITDIGIDIWSVGARIWVSEDISLLGDYGWRSATELLPDGNRLKVSLLMRWLD